jgi:Ca2+-binding EF-hand superfamily protein
VTDISISLGILIDKKTAKKGVKLLLEAADTGADTGLDGLVQFEEFVCFAKTRPDLFGNLYSWAEQDVLEELGLQVHKKLADVPLVLQRLFVSHNADGNGCLDSSELTVLVRDVARTFDMRMSKAQVQEEVRKILAQLGKGLDGTLTGKEFVAYVQAHPQIFGPLMVWQTLFAKYMGPEGGIGGAGLLQLAIDISVSLGIPLDKRTAQERANELLVQADTGLDGLVQFEEFVVFAKKRPQLFGQLLSLSETEVLEELEL